MEEKFEAKKPAAPATTAPSGAPSRPMGRRKPEFRRKVCRLCVDHTDHIDYKNVQFLRTFTMDSGKILSRRITGTCAKHQRQIAAAIKRNRNLAALPYCAN